MSPEEQALATVIHLLRHLAIPFMLTGSVATSYHGRPRTTHDADVVVDPSPSQLDALVSGLDAAGFYLDPEGARRALAARSQFNAIEIHEACKIDLIIRRDRPFSKEEFGRRITVDLSFIQGIDMVTPEDAILSKLEWARRAGESERQLADARSVLQINPGVDRDYIDRWAAELGVGDLWARIDRSSRAR